jgi:hypothetical protein
MATYSIPGLTLKGVVNPFVQELVTRFQTRYISALQSAPSNWADVVSGLTPVGPGDLSVKFPIDLSDLGPGMREWLGERHIERTDLTGFSIDTRRFEKTKGIDKGLAQAGPVNAMFRSFPDKATQGIVQAARQMRPLLVASVLKLGKTKAKTYQDIPLFVGSGAATKHLNNPLNASKGEFYNLYTARNFTETTYEEMKLELETRKGPDGVSTLGLQVTHVLGGTRMGPKFKRLFKPELVSNAGGTATESNIFQGDAIPLVAPELDDDPVVLTGKEVWYLIATNVMARPVEALLENGGAPNITIFGEGSETAEMRGEIIVAGDMKAAAGAALPHVIIRVEGT